MNYETSEKIGLSAVWKNVIFESTLFNQNHERRQSTQSQHILKLLEPRTDDSADWRHVLHRLKMHHYDLADIRITQKCQTSDFLPDGTLVYMQVSLIIIELLPVRLAHRMLFGT